MTFVEFITNPIVVQFIGFIGVGISILSFQCKSYQKLIWMRVFSELAFAIQYFLLGAYTGMATNLVSCVTNSVYRERVKRGKSTLWFQVSFGILFVLTGILTWQGPRTLLVIGAKVLSTVANGLGDGKKIRNLTLIVMLLWIVYDSLVFSIAGICSDVLTIISVLLAMLRLDKKSKA